MTFPTDYTVKLTEATSVITWEDILSVADGDPAIKAINEDIKKEIILYAVHTQIPFIWYEQSTKFVRCYFGAHLASRQVTRSAGTGTRSGESEDGISISNTQETNNPSASDHHLHSTAWGRVIKDIVIAVKLARINS